MLSRIHHRGPDDEGVAAMGGATLGVRRLSIIDLTTGHQPMQGEDDGIVAIQNGELYNFLDLRNELESRGHRFRTHSDTEVLPHAYEEWGVDMVTRLRGMFAFAIWDEPRQLLLLARDRFGKKPLIYSELNEGGGLVFASEIQALLAHPVISRDVDAAAIEEYLTFGYIPAPRTAFLAMRKVPPGHVLVRTPSGLSVDRYWRPAFSPKLTISFDDAAEELRRRIDDAVRVRLMSDVPIGAFLSGGLDSSAVVAFMARHSERPVKTFSIGFRDQAYDELSYARVVATEFGTDHHEFVVDAGETDVLPLLVRHLGEPFADSSIVPTYHVARITREHVTVALNGDGGDELFAGYDRYKAAALARLTVERLPRALAVAVAEAAAAVGVPARAPRTLQRARRFLAALALPPEARFLRWTGYFTGDVRRLVFGDRLASGGYQDALTLLGDASALTGAIDPAERYMASDMLMNLPGDLLVKMDIATMANSLEARSPLLDHKLAEFVVQLPAHYKLSPRTSKRLMRHAMRGVLPERILRRGKMGFMAPVAAWLRGPLAGPFSDLVPDGLAVDAGFVSAAGVRTLFRQHTDGVADRAGLLWALFMLELWFRECARGQTAVASASRVSDVRTEASGEARRPS